MAILNTEQIKDKVEELVTKIKSDDSLMDKFKSEPINTIEGLLGVDLPDDTVSKIVDGVKAKLGADKVSSIFGKLGGLFGNKD